MSKHFLPIGLVLEVVALIGFWLCVNMADFWLRNIERSPLAVLGLMIGSGVASFGFALAGGFCLLGAAIAERPIQQATRSGVP